eukprot:gene3593-biopygen9563
MLQYSPPPRPLRHAHALQHTLHCQRRICVETDAYIESSVTGGGSGGNPQPGGRLREGDPVLALELLADGLPRDEEGEERGVLPAARGEGAEPLAHRQHRRAQRKEHRPLRDGLREVGEHRVVRAPHPVLPRVVEVAREGVELPPVVAHQGGGAFKRHLRHL